MATRSGEGRGEEGVVRGGCGEGSWVRVVVGAAVTRGGASGESLAAPEHAAVTMTMKIGTNRDETTRVRLWTSITYLKLYHSLARQRGPDLMRIHWVLRPSQSVSVQEVETEEIPRPPA